MSATLKYEDVEDDRRSDHRTIFLVMIGLAMIPIIVYAAAVLLTWGKLPRGTFVSNVDVGGKTSAEAKAMLRAELEPRLSQPVPVTAAEVSTEVVPAETGLSIDYDKTVDGLAASSVNPITVARSFSGRTDHDPKIMVDDAAITKTVDALAKRIDKPKREGSVKLAGTKIVVVKPAAGRTLDREMAVKTLHERFAAVSTEPVDVPVTPIDVVTSAEEVDAAVKLVTPTVSGPLRLAADGRGVDLTVQQIASLLSLDLEETGGYTLAFDSAGAKALILPQLKSYDTPSKDGSIDVIKGAVRIVPSINGRTADVDALVALIPQALASAVPRELPITFTAVEPKLT
ncbi:MAG: peptidoglycan binding domain-containing protein, partial [Mycobacteriales bacterium]